MDNEKYDRTLKYIDMAVHRCTELRKFDVEWNRTDDVLSTMGIELKRRITIYHEMNLDTESTLWATFKWEDKDKIVLLCRLKPNSVIVTAHIHDATVKEVALLDPMCFRNIPELDMDLYKTCIFCRWYSRITLKHKKCEGDYG